MDARVRARAAEVTQRLARRTDFKVRDMTQCWHPVATYGGGGGSRYYGPSYDQCRRPPMWLVPGDKDERGWTPGYCGQHARMLGLLDEHGPQAGVVRRSY